MNGDKVVYVHKNSDGVIKYVGSGTIERAIDNRKNRGRCKEYDLYIDKYGKLSVEILYQNLSTIEAENIEREIYCKHKDTLLNANKPSSVKELMFDVLNDYLYYDITSSTFLRWKVDVGRGSSFKKAGSEAGALHKATGYYRVVLNGQEYKAHRIVAVLNGIDVNNLVIDHIDRNRANNNIQNLRAVTSKENNNNVSQLSDNESGVRKIFWRPSRNSWVVPFYINDKRKVRLFSISRYGNKEDALLAAIDFKNSIP